MVTDCVTDPLIWFCNLLWEVSGYREGVLKCPLTRLGPRPHFAFIFIMKDSTVNDNVVTTGPSISKQRPCAFIYSVSIAWIVRLEIE